MGAVLVGQRHPLQGCGSPACPSLPWGVLGSPVPPHSASIVPLLSPVLGDVKWAQVLVLAFTLRWLCCPILPLGWVSTRASHPAKCFWVPGLGQSDEVGGDGTSLRLFLLLLFLSVRETSFTCFCSTEILRQWMLNLSHLGHVRGRKEFVRIYFLFFSVGKYLNVRGAG